MGYNNPSKIQETALPTLIADPPQNMIAQSQSGTGKTAGKKFIIFAINFLKLNHIVLFKTKSLLQITDAEK